MSTYNNNRYTPGNKANLRLFMNKAFIRQYYQAFNISQTFDIITTGSQLTNDDLCGCIQQKSNAIKQGWNDPSQTENMRNYLGGWEGQPGGQFRPLRNKF
jgi:hypothetical protein